MPARADETGRLTEAQICEIVGTSQQRRQTWVSKSLLRKTRTKGYSLRDTLALAQLLRLIEVLGPTDGVAAWQQSRDELDQPFAAGVLDVIFDIQLKEAIVVHESHRIGELVAHGRPVRVVRLGPRRLEVAAAFDRLLEAVVPAERREATTPRPKRRQGGERGA